MKRTAYFLFLLATSGMLISLVTEATLLHFICKPALMLTLGLYYVFAQREKSETLSKPVVLAILFSCAGDTLLMLQSYADNFFMYGLAAFLVAHVFYIFAYRQHQWADTTNALQGLQKIRYAFPVVLSGTGLAVVLYARLGDLKLPVLLYAVVITVMVLQALFRFGKTTSASFAMVFGGAMLFMISDALIAINKFLEPLPHANLWIMITYITAQYLIVMGLIRYEKE